jgi:transposase-like protein
MKLYPRMDKSTLTYRCPICDYAIINKGIWFRSISTFRCPKCKGQVSLPYSEKIAIFQKHPRFSTLSD